MYSNATEFDTVLLFQVSSYAIRDAEEYKNFCDRPKDQRPLPEEVIGVSFKVLYRLRYLVTGNEAYNGLN